ncbi:heparinase II/III domain-containing protein [Actinoplanes derwentensis]|uniref:Heparinase II/III-like protein n=1 Tax=Actinoplanes derwentensis TaxID=113562 RepID=A0A1H1Z5L8_9ACTN|nr:heparinase II/III family protein [Actinoplanes derwentensis]GID81438.1 heparinase [Actinoplanes derwentensis]SDT28879.1 Heparinase II/III-like protein [Actinoplanes derwentensis]
MRVAPAGDRRTWDSVDQPTVRALEERARAALGTPWPTPLAHDFARVFRDGDRDTYEQAIWVRHERLARAVALAAATLDPMWLDEVADGVILFCEQSTWCWPAHDDTLERHGSVLPTVTDPYVDLGAGEVAADLAWTDHVLGALLDERYPGLRDRIRYEVKRRVFDPFTARRDWQWLGLDGDVNNWNPWIHSNILVAALLLAPESSSLVDLVVEGLAHYEAAIPADGAIDEGYHYWWYGACRYLEALELLGRPLDASLVAFPHRVHLGGPWYLNHADGPAKPSYQQPWHALHRLARLVGSAEAEAHAAAQRRPGEPVAHETQGLGYLLHALTDADWIAAVPGSSPLPREVWFPSTQVLLARQHAGSAAGLTLAVKGGHNDENHNHNDIGSFIIARDGVPILVDPGRPTYTAQTFGPQRYDIWTMQSAWHNTPTIRGTQQAPGRAFAARDVTVGDGTVSMDIAGAYPRDDIRSWVRTARLDRSTGTVTIRDTWELAPSPGPGSAPTVIHLIVAGDPEPGFLPDGLPYSIVVKELDDPMLSGVWGSRLTRLDIDVTSLGPVGTYELSVSFAEENR